MAILSILLFSIRPFELPLSIIPDELKQSIFKIRILLLKMAKMKNKNWENCLLQNEKMYF